MKRSAFVCVLFVAAAGALVAQSSQPGLYSGKSNPPPDSTIIDNTPPPAVPQPAPVQAPSQNPNLAKPSPSRYAQPPAPAQSQFAPVPQPAAGSADGTDDGIVQVAPSGVGQPGLNERVAEVSDPDGDIVHPAPLPPGQLGPGTEIRVRLLDRLSTAENRSGDAFKCRVASDVFQGNDILIPAGAEIDGTVVEASAGHLGGHGSMLLRPEAVILPDGSRFHLYAQTSGAPDSNARVRGEGNITPGSRLKKDGIEYGGAVGAGAITGGILGGPPGALAGTLIGAGAVTVHLLVSHPQATLEPGAVLLFSLTEPLNLAAAAPGAQPSTNAQPLGDAQPTANAQPDQAQPAPDAQPSNDAQPAGDAQPANAGQSPVAQN
jgi:hypothetical protein